MGRRTLPGILLMMLASAMALRAAAPQMTASKRLAAYAAATPHDAIARLQRQIDAGEVTLTFDPKWGYLPSLLTALKIPASSQSLVYSKTSFQLDKIAPSSPRAIYFGDDVYLGWVLRGTVIEVADVDPALGAVFYTLDQQAQATPKFERQTHNCLQCHDSVLNTGGVPGFVMQSVFIDKFGYPLPSSHDPVSNDRTPLKEKFGGWYVSGTHGADVHMGNVVPTQSVREIGNAQVYIDSLDLKATGNVTDIAPRFNSKMYYRTTSDIVALSLLAHQTSVHNLMTQAAIDAGTPQADASAEALVRGLLFIGEYTLKAPIAGASTFAADFAALGPRDAKGRSLRLLDLKTRLMRYPLSYLIYSEGFAGLPASVKQYVARRVNEVLNGREDRAEFATMSADDRAAVREILRDTMPGFLPVQAHASR